MKKYIAHLLLLSVLLLSGCTGELQEYTLETQATEPASTELVTEEEPTLSETRPKEQRDYATYPVEQPKDYIVGNRYYYAQSPVIRYYDLELRRSVSLCSQPNCTHNSDLCVAYLGGGGRTKYSVVGDLVYALVDDLDKGGKLLFIERNMITGETRILWDLTPPEDVVREYVQFSVYGEEAFLIYREFEMEWNDIGTTYSEKNPVQYSYAIDLLSGERELLLKDEMPAIETYVLWGSTILPELCSEDYLLIKEVERGGELPISMDEYFEQNPTKDHEDYHAYYMEVYGQFEKVSRYCLNRKTGEKKWVYGNDLEAHIQDSSSTRDRKQAFTVGNTVCVYDGCTGQVTAYFEQENIGYMGYLDGRIIYNVYTPMEDGDAEWSYFWYDLQTGEKQPFQVGIQGMVFSLQAETADYFYGYSTKAGGNRFISKQDFYNENYDAAF